MKIIGHRGACGLALENTLPSLELARLLGVDAIEFDVRKTKDGELVLCHDADLGQVASSTAKVADLTLTQVRKITLKDGVSIIPTLTEAMRVTGKTPIIVELKVKGCIPRFLEILKQFKEVPVTVASFKHSEALQLKKLRPDIKVFIAERTNAFEALRIARRNKLDGLDLNFWLLNPVVYWLAKRHNIEIMVYTLNNKLLTKFVNLFYPTAGICTDHPEWFIKHPWLRLRQNSKKDQK